MCSRTSEVSLHSWVTLCSRFELLVSILEGFDYKGFQSKAIKRNAATQMATVYPEGLRMEGCLHVSAVTNPARLPLSPRMAFEWNAAYTAVYPEGFRMGGCLHVPPPGPSSTLADSSPSVCVDSFSPSILADSSPFCAGLYTLFVLINCRTSSCVTIVRLSRPFISTFMAVPRDGAYGPRAKGHQPPPPSGLEQNETRIGNRKE